MLTYKDAGVDVDAGNRFVENIKPLIQRTRRPEMMGDLGGFGGLFALPKGYQEPILVSSTDGVGTKLRLCIDSGKHDTIGIDLVAMCVNDIIVQGAEPLFFLDYFATGHLNLGVAESIIQGITEGCVEANASLIGGETAEMPGLYQKSDYDLAGFCVGIVEKSRLLDGTQAREGDILLGLPSSGPHANGYSLIRKILSLHNLSLDTPFEDSTLKEHLLAPTLIYVRPLLALAKQGLMKGAAHITGGGLTENLPRVFSDTLQASIPLSAWQWPPIFQWLQKMGNVPLSEMLRTFNCGMGMVVIVSPEQVDTATQLLHTFHITPTVIGRLVPRVGKEGVVFEGSPV
jgi:phosphoribosylformylglycinamidine cyclo-ligase